MPKQSAGLLMFRRTGGRAEVLLAHPGGPFWQHRDLGAWTIPKGQLDPGEAPLDAARREFREETGLAPPPLPAPGASSPYLSLTPLKQKSGKLVHAWAFEGDCDPSCLSSNGCRSEWPARSGKWITHPEIDRAAWFDLAEARRRILPGQAPFLDELARAIGEPGPAMASPSPAPGLFDR